MTAEQPQALAAFLAAFAAGMVASGQQRHQVAVAMVAAGVVQQVAEVGPAATASWLRRLADRAAALEASAPAAEQLAALLATPTGPMP